MIQIKKQKITVEFAKDENGAIAVTAQDTHLCLKELAKKNIKIGTDLKKGYSNALPSITMEFHNTESVEVMIKALKIIKRHLEMPYGSLPYAC